MEGKQKSRQKKVETQRDLLWAEFQNWPGAARVSQKKMDSLLEEFREFNQRILEKKEQEQRIGYFELLVDELLQSCFTSRTKAEEIKIQLWKGRAYETFGEWRKALAAYQRAIDLCDVKELTSYKAEAHRWLGHIQLMQNRDDEALKSFQESLKLAQDYGDESCEAGAYNGLASYYFEKGDLDGATAYWQKALELAEQLNIRALIAGVNNNLGVVANVQGNWGKALAYYGESLSQVEKIGDSRGLAETYHNMGMTYAAAARWAEAGANYEKGYELAKAVGDVRLQANIRLTRVELYLAVGDSYLAEAMCRQALRTYLHLEDHLGEADCYKFLGVIHGARYEWSTAKSFFEKSIQLTGKFKSPLCKAEAHFEYGKMWKQKGNNKSAQKQLEQALRLFTKINAEKDIEKVERELAEL